MYKKTLLLSVFIFSCLLISCRTTRQETQKTENQTQITSEKVVIYKDTTVYAPRAETELRIPLSELVAKSQLKTDSQPIFYVQKNAQAKVKLKIVHDTISISATCDSLAIVAKIKNEFKKESSNVIKNNTIESKQKTGYSFIHIGIAFLLGFAFCYIIKFFKIV
ncbi:hypothetical protein [Flavobacterium sp. AJR]|uniref:hypothetical protein n=1 Tax=Flavobacterium sp. AJR TaxID=1979369 RepID=UPI000A3D80CD|nr:hypothetical protein [Flavobacterium sp. AJR]OUL63107.1 hypothetical protein B8T70_06855 [Flavobacterium sp. AJR]